MKKIFPLLILISFFTLSVTGQTREINGKPIAELFTDFHASINDTIQKTGFGLNRAYLGYQFLPEGNFSAKITVNIGSPDDLPEGSELRRYAYFREASLKWSENNLSVTMGITGTELFEFQQNFWGKRYVAKPYQMNNGYGYAADLGVAVDYRINNILKADLTVMNGEGYCNIQQDNNIRTSLGLTITPGEYFAFRFYGDIQKMENVWQNILIGFGGYKNNLFYVGGEVSYKSNLDLTKGHHAWGISTTGGINLNKKTELFGRFDYISSVVASDDILKWNYLNDGNFAITGVQYTFSPNVRAAINYQVTNPYAEGACNKDLIFLNALFKF